MHIDNEKIVNEIIQFPTTTTSVYYIRRAPNQSIVPLPLSLPPNIQRLDNQGLFPHPLNNNRLVPNLPNNFLPTSTVRGRGEEGTSKVRKQIKLAQKEIIATTSLLLKKEEYTSLLATHGVDKILPIKCLGKILSTPRKPKKLQNSLGSDKH